MITRYVIAETEHSARAALDLYLSLSEGDQELSDRVHTTELRAWETLTDLRIDDQDHHDRVWACACTIWRLIAADPRAECST